MARPDPQREPRTETAEKKGIGKSHEEFIGDMAQPSISRQEYETRKRNKPKGTGRSRPLPKDS